jgi:hypothetical protein
LLPNILSKIIKRNWVLATIQFMTTCHYLLFTTIIGYFCNYLLHFVVFITTPMTNLWLMFSSLFHWKTFNMVLIQKTHLYPISCKCVQMNYNLVCIQRLFCVFHGVWVYNDVLSVFYFLIYGWIPKHTSCVYNILCIIVIFFTQIISF